MLNKKEVADTLAKSLITGGSIASIMLKAQMLASLLENEEFSNWVRYEQNGYPEGVIVPEYRRIGCSVKAHISLPYGGMWKNMSVPPDSIDDEQVNKRIFTVALGESVSSLEAFSANSDGRDSLIVALPAYVFPYIDRVFDGPYHNVIKAWQTFPRQAVKGIVEKIKSELLNFILILDKSLNLDIDFTLEDKSKVAHIMNTTINANMVHTGNGNLNADNCNSIVGDNSQIVMSDNSKAEIKELVNKLSALKSQIEVDEIEFTEYLDEIKQELDKKITSPKIIRKALRAIKSLGGIITEKAVEFGIDRVIASLPF
ncbi:MAG: hypothetical protein K2M55_00655 [Muribaculaceae bacterium]|nr:hypothetical protein [Muribaculaceae bacterium]